MRAVIYGSRPDGQAKIVVQLAADLENVTVVGLLDDYPENQGRTIAGFTVVGTGDDLDAVRASGVDALLLGFGESHGRAAIVERAAAAGLELPKLVHGTAVVYGSASIDPGAQIFPLAHVGADAYIGAGALVNTAAIIEHDAVLESGAVVLPNATLSGRTRIGRDATIGAGAVVLPDVSIGERAIVGAGSVVVRDIAPGDRVAGVPARPLPAKPPAG